MSFTSAFIPRLIFWYQGYADDPSNDEHKLAGYIDRIFPESHLPSNVCEFNELSIKFPDRMANYSYLNYSNNATYDGPAFSELNTSWTEVVGWDCGPCRFPSFRDEGTVLEFRQDFAPPYRLR
jgi:hypothetical protein